MTDFQEISQALIKFRDERDWAQFHDTKNLAIALSIEASELNEILLWKNQSTIEQEDLEKIKEELADIFAYAFLLAEKNKLNVKQIILDKIKKNELKYPIEKSKGNSKKYKYLQK